MGKDEEVRRASQVAHHGPITILPKDRDDMESLNPRARGGLVSGLMFRRRASDNKPGTPLARPNDAPAPNRPRTPEQIEAHNARIRAEDEARWATMTAALKESAKNETPPPKSSTSRGRKGTSTSA